MNTHKNIIRTGSFLVLAFVGLVITALIIAPSVMRPSTHPEHLPGGETSRALATPLAYVTLPPRSTLPAAHAPDSAPVTLPETLVAPVTINDTPASSPVEPVPAESSRSYPVNNSAGSSAAPAVSSAAPSAPTLLPGPTPSPTPTSPAMSTPTPPTPGRISGRVLLDGAPAQGVHLRLEDDAYNVLAQTTVKSDGGFVFPDLEPTGGGYNVVFAQKWNTQYDIDEVISWGWIGPVPVGDGKAVDLPDFDISLQGFGGINPEPNAAVSARALSPDNPLQFEWSAHPEAVAYWVDLAKGEDDEQTVVWQSALSQDDSLAFDGTLKDGEQIKTGEYWWGVGARNDTEPYPVTMYAYLSALRIKP